MHIRDTRALHSEIYFANADDPGGLMIGQLCRHTNSTLTFVITSLSKVETYPGIGDYIWWYEVLQEGVVKGIRKKDFELALELGKIELVN